MINLQQVPPTDCILVLVHYEPYLKTDLINNYTVNGKKKHAPNLMCTWISREEINVKGAIYMWFTLIWVC